jgi:hypothetical protein
MVKHLLGLGALLVLGAVVGCGGGTSSPSSKGVEAAPDSEADKLLKEQIALMNDMATAIEKKELDTKAKIEEKTKEIGKKLDALKLSEADQKKLQEKYKGELEKAMARVMAAGLKAAGDVGGLKDKDTKDTKDTKDDKDTKDTKKDK